MTRKGNFIQKAYSMLEYYDCSNSLATMTCHFHLVCVCKCKQASKQRVFLLQWPVKYFQHSDIAGTSFNLRCLAFSCNNKPDVTTINYLFWLPCLLWICDILMYRTQTTVWHKQRARGGGGERYTTSRYWLFIVPYVSGKETHFYTKICLKKSLKLQTIYLFYK